MNSFHHQRILTNFKWREELREADEEEKEVEEEFELVEEDHGEEGEQVVLSVIDLVVNMPLGLVTPACHEEGPLLHLLEY
jgi:hypothetical protein